jgi:hypothetical protein
MLMVPILSLPSASTTMMSNILSVALKIITTWRILLDVAVEIGEFIDWIVDNNLNHQEDDEYNPFSSYGHDSIKRDLEFYDYCNAENMLQYLQEGNKRKVKYSR